MKKWLLFLFCITLFLTACADQKSNALSEGMWRAELAVMDGHTLPFNFELKKSDSEVYTIEIYNAEEVITVDEINIKNDSIIIKMPVFEGYLAGTFTENAISGDFIKESLDRIVPFVATFNKSKRFDVKGAAAENISGIWETIFVKETGEEYIAKGIFKQVGDNVSGTFETTTGDYRYLDGVVDEDSLKISAFDGAHAFLFTAKVSDSSMNGVFYSGNHSKEPFRAKRNKAYMLPSTDSLTFIKDGYDSLAFSFPDANGTMISLADKQFENKVVLVQIMGSWCPNCLDETVFYTKYLAENPHADLAIIGLAFEYAKTKEKAFNSLKRLSDRIGVKYPFLLAQYGSSDKVEAQEKLPMLNHVLSYPTTIYIDKKGDVRKIHTGFNGPATGAKYDVFKKEFDAFVKELLAEE